MDRQAAGLEYNSRTAFDLLMVRNKYCAIEEKFMFCWGHIPKKPRPQVDNLKLLNVILDFAHMCVVVRFAECCSSRRTVYKHFIQ